MAALRPTRPVNDNASAKAHADPALLASAMALADGRGAAIALQLDPARHMRLRLACALTGRSAQAIIGDALDQHLGMMPDIERLIAEAVAEGGDQAAAGWGSDV